MTWLPATQMLLYFINEAGWKHSRALTDMSR